MIFKRLIDVLNASTSAFLFGPRMTGKTTFLREIKADRYFDLLDPELEMNYRREPRLFWEQISAVGEKGVIIVDEIQKVPELLNYAQMGIDRLHQVFFLSGSSARKLKRGGSNLLGGRALDLKIYPLTHIEAGERFSIQNALLFGTLPKVMQYTIEDKNDLALGHLKSYASTYIKEEIQSEALTRNIGSFQRFLAIAAQSNAQVIEFANIARESSVPASTVKEYYQILEDTLLGCFLWPYDRNERKKARPKFYFFDCGVVRSIQNSLGDSPAPNELGFLFETWMVNELIRLNEYYRKSHEFSFWRENRNEIDILISKKGKIILAIECKSGKTEPARECLLAFGRKFPGVRIVVASLTDTMPRLIHKEMEMLPWKNILDLYIREF